MVVEWAQQHTHTCPDVFPREQQHRRGGVLNAYGTHSTPSNLTKKQLSIDILF